MEQVDANQDGLSYIISKMPWYTHLVELVNEDTWSTTSSTEPKVYIQNRITELYKCLVEYKLRSFHVRNHKLKAIASNTFQLSNWKKSLEEIKCIEDEIITYIDTISQSDLRQKFHRLLNKTEELRRDISILMKEEIGLLRGMGENVEDLRNITRNRAKRETWERFKLDKSELDIKTYQQHVDGLDELQPGTGLGVLEHQSYIDWKERDRGLLILAARPGVGKSVLAKHIRDQARGAGSQIVCSFFFKDISSGQKSPYTALCHIFYDILRGLSRISHSPDLDDEIENLEKEEIRPECELLWRIIGIVGQHCAVTIVLDALDEAVETGRLSLVVRIWKFYSNFQDAKVKFLLTTRPLKDIPNELGQFILDMDVDSGSRKAVRHEIIQVAEKKLDNLALDKHISTPEKRELLELLQDYKDSTYLFIKLLFQYAQSIDGIYQDWVQIFKSLPREIYQVYKKFLEDVRPGNRPLVQAMYQILLAATRPLTVTEMKIAVKLNLQPNTNCQRKEDFFLLSDESMEAEIRGSCGFLFDIVAGQVYPIHQTVKDYFLEGEYPTWLPKFDIADCHKMLAEICMDYISLPFIANDPGFKSIGGCIGLLSSERRDYHSWCKESFDFGEYGFHNWILHFKESHIGSQGQLEPEAPLLSKIASDYRDIINLATNIFCCSALPTHISA